MATPLEPNRPSPDAVDADALAVPGGVRPVVWRVDAAAPHALSPQLARALLYEHTRRGDVVVDIDDDVAFAAAAAETARRHHALGGGHRLAPIGDAAGYVDLVLLRWPRTQAANPRWLLVACRTLLRHGSGVLAVAISVPAVHRTSHLSALTGAAAPPRSGATADGCGHAPAAASPVAPHTDLLIFATEAGHHD